MRIDPIDLKTRETRETPETPARRFAGRRRARHNAGVRLSIGLTLAFSTSVLVAAPACRAPNRSHCYWADDPGAACVAKSDGARPFCSKCTAAADGCVASASEVDESCLVGEEAASNTATGEGTETDTTTTDGTDTSDDTETTSTDESTDDTTDGTTDDTTDDTTETGGPDCGNGEIDPGESCDGMNLNDKTCEDLGRPPGELLCDEFCLFDDAGCCKPNGTVCESDDECCTGKCDMLVTNKCTNL